MTSRTSWLPMAAVLAVVSLFLMPAWQASAGVITTPGSNLAILWDAAAGPAAVSTIGLTSWLKADQGVVIDGSNNVLGWNDVSGKNHHATAPGSLPVLVPGAVAGKPVIRFDGTFPDVTGYLRHLYKFDPISGVTGVRILADSSVSFIAIADLDGADDNRARPHERSDQLPAQPAGG